LDASSDVVNRDAKLYIYNTKARELAPVSQRNRLQTILVHGQITLPGLSSECPSEVRIKVVRLVEGNGAAFIGTNFVKRRPLELSIVMAKLVATILNREL
jgi:hypothetical protein